MTQPVTNNSVKPTTDSNERVINITDADLPLHCPMDGESLWDSHPRVFLPIEQSGEELCPYCGTRYILDKSST